MYLNIHLKRVLSHILKTKPKDHSSSFIGQHRHNPVIGGNGFSMGF